MSTEMGLDGGGSSGLSAFMTVIGSLMVVEFLVGVFGNYLLLHVFWRFKQLRTPSNTLVIALAVADIGMCCCIPFSTASMFSGHWIFDTTGCKLYGFASMFFGLAVIGLLMSFSIDHYICICRRPLASTLTDTHYKFMALAAYLNAVFWAILPILGWGRYDEDIGSGCSIDWGRGDLSYVSYLFALFTVCFVLPVTVMAVCFGRAHAVLTKRPEVREDILDSRRNPVNSEWVEQRRVTQMGVALLAVFLITWSPFAFICLWGALGNPDNVPKWLAIAAPFTAKCSQILNPLVFFIFIKKFRDSVWIMLCCQTPVEAIQLPPPPMEQLALE